MKISLPTEKKDRIKTWSAQLRKKSQCKIRDLAKFFGTLVSACPAIKYGWIYTKLLDRERILAHVENSTNFDAKMSIPLHLHADLLW